MKKVSGEWWFLSAGLLALSVSLILRAITDLKGDAVQFIEGLCIGLSVSLLLGGLIKVRRDAHRDSGRV
jgi:hypothetical protein